MKHTASRLLHLSTLALALVWASCGGQNDGALIITQNVEVSTTGALSMSVTATDENGAPLPAGSYKVGIHGRDLPAPGPIEYTGLSDGQRIAVVVDFGGLRVFQWINLRRGSAYTVDTTGPDAKWGDWPMSEATESVVGDRMEVFIRFLPLRVLIDATEENGTLLPAGRYSISFGGHVLSGPRYYGINEPAPANIAITHHGRLPPAVDFGGLRAYQTITFQSGQGLMVDTTGPTARWGDWPTAPAASAPHKEAHIHFRFLPLRVLIDATDENGTLLPAGRYSISFGGHVLSGPRYYGINEPAPANIAITHHGRLPPAVDFGGLRAYQTITFQSGQGLMVDTTGPTARWGDWPTAPAASAPHKEAHIHFRFLPLTLVVEAVTPDLFHIPHSASALQSTFRPGPLYFRRLTTAPAVTHHGNFPVYVTATEGPQAGFRVYQPFVAKERQRYTIDATQGGSYWGNWPNTSDTLSYGKTVVVRVMFTHAYGLQSIPALSERLSAIGSEHDQLPLEIRFETEPMHLVPAE